MAISTPEISIHGIAEMFLSTNTSGNTHWTNIVVNDDAGECILELTLFGKGAPPILKLGEPE